VILRPSAVVLLVSIAQQGIDVAATYWAGFVLQVD